MLSTGNLYGAPALLEGNEDFDTKAEVKQISTAGANTILDVYKAGYDGIDISLFDFEVNVVRAILEGIKLRKLSSLSILGTTASNWKGVKSEKSPVTPAEALRKAQLILEETQSDLLMKVDEPGIFKVIYDILSKKLYESSYAEILEITEKNIMKPMRRF